jgi:hypothetical protein
MASGDAKAGEEKGDRTTSGVQAGRPVSVSGWYGGVWISLLNFSC